MVQVNNTPITLRIKFIKVGNLQYVSHLDLVRTMHKVIVRSKLPLWYTEGFNPKPKMVFAAPLSTGTESIAEYMDLRLCERIDPKEAVRRLNLNLTKDMRVLDAYYPERKLTELSWLLYTIKIKTNGDVCKNAELASSLLSSEKIEIMKKTKSGEALTDIRPLIKSASAVCDGDMIRISCILSAEQSKFLSPEYIVKALREKCGILSSQNLTEEYYSIMRECGYLSDMTVFS